MASLARRKQQTGLSRFVMHQHHPYFLSYLDLKNQIKHKYCNS